MAGQLTTYRFTTKDYHRMAEAGIFGEDDRVELLQGEIVEMAPIGSRHASCVDRLNRLFSRQVGERAVVRVQNPIRLGEHSEPQPDLALLHPRADFYAQGHPGPEEIFLIVEVMESSAGYDRAVKVPLYARSGIPETWLVDLERGVIEVYCDPGSEGYRQVNMHRRGERLSPQAFPHLTVMADAILG